jgi:hypothetical protein
VVVDGASHTIVIWDNVENAFEVIR